MGIEHWGRVPALNTNDVFIDDLADAVAEALPYVGSLQRSSTGSPSLPSTDALVPLGEHTAVQGCPARVQRVWVLPAAAAARRRRRSVARHSGDGRGRAGQARLDGAPPRRRGPAELQVTAAVRSARRRLRKGWLCTLLHLSARFNGQAPLL